MQTPILLLALSLAILPFPRPALVVEPPDNDVVIFDLAPSQTPLAAPPLTLTHLLQTPDGTPAADELSWTYFQNRGHVVILEFWATWCGPCNAAIPHLNELADNFKNRPVTFVAITDEPEDIIRPFLEKRHMRSWIGIDTSKAMHKAFGIRGIPHTVLIDQHGRIAGITHPNELTTEHIEKLLAGSPTGLPVEQPKPAPATASRGPAPIFEISITPKEEDNGWRMMSGGLGAVDQTTGILGLVVDTYGFYNTPRLILPDDWQDGLYTFKLRYPRERHEEFQPLMQQVLRSAFGITARTETREVDVLILTAPRGPGPGLVKSGAGAGASKGGWDHWQAINQPVDGIAVSLESALKKIVIDETNLKDEYDFELNWDRDDPQSLARIVEESLGLVLIPARREVEFLIIERLPSAPLPDVPAAAMP